MTLAQALERIEKLEADVAWLKEIATDRYVRDEISLVMQGLGVTPQQAIMILELKAAYPRPVQRWALLDRMPPRNRDAAANEGQVLASQVSQVRKKLGREFLLTLGRQGYALGEAAYNRTARLVA